MSCCLLFLLAVQPALSMSISHSSFQAELEGAILQQTASVDLYLQTAAPKWSPECYAHDDGCEGTGLRSLFLSDLSSASGTWQPLPSVISHVDPAWALQHGRKRRPRLQPLQVRVHAQHSLLASSTCSCPVCRHLQQLYHVHPACVRRRTRVSMGCCQHSVGACFQRPQPRVGVMCSVVLDHPWVGCR